MESYRGERKKKLGRQLAKTENPAIRIQLQAMIDRKSNRPDHTIRRIEDAPDCILYQVIERLPDDSVLVLMYIAVTIVLLVIFIVMEDLA